MLSAARNRWWWSRGSGLVNMSARLSMVGTCSSAIWPDFNSSRREWWRMSMCLTLPWSLVFLDKAIAPRLSPLITPGMSYPIWTSSNQLCIQTICWAHLDIATYSASTVESATVACLLCYGQYSKAVLAFGTERVKEYDNKDFQLL